uniref:Nuclease associated modular domain-containing protein n=1 Tax=viral metagenome TaxID=1070528 RepID=A0A6M3XDC0_9ZZZZ
MRNNKGQFQKGHSEGARFGSGQSFGSKDKYKKISESQKGRVLTREHKDKISISSKGKIISKETRNKLSITHKRLGTKPPINIGINNINWKGGISKESDIIRHSIEGTLWRNSVFARDGYTCQITGIKGCNLVAHHINNFADYPKLRFAIDNGITISKEVHLDFHKKYGRKNNTKEQLVEFSNTYDGFIVGQNL